MVFVFISLVADDIGVTFYVLLVICMASSEKLSIQIFCPLHIQVWASRLPQRVQVLSAKPYDLSLVPMTHIVEGKNQLLRVVFYPHICTMT